jgi:hypothetical protein
MTSGIHMHHKLSYYFVIQRVWNKQEACTYKVTQICLLLFAEMWTQQSYCRRITYTDLSSVHLGYPCAFREELPTRTYWNGLYGCLLRECFDNERNLSNLHKPCHIAWQLLPIYSSHTHNTILSILIEQTRHIETKDSSLLHSLRSWNVLTFDSSLLW